ncbi:MAG: hypothetical protein ACK6BG_07260 [Cyanobacteriota bacterium]
MIQLRQAIILLIFCSFGLGISCLSQRLFVQKLSLKAQTIAPEEQSPHQGLAMIIGIIAYCLVCNLLLIIPASLQMLGLPGVAVPMLHQLSLACCLALTLAISSVGMLSLLRSSWPSDLLWFPRSIPQPSKEALIAIALSSGVFLVFAQLNSISYDLGLYHFPYIKHLLDFGPEIGLANLHSRFGFYNTQFFGQLPWQYLLGKSSNALSPSLNILFFSSFLLHFIEALFPAGSRSECDQNLRINSLLLFGLGLTIGSYNFGSIAGFDADFSLGLASLVFIDQFYRATGFRHQRHLLPALMLLPLIKFSGILALCLVIIYLLSHALLNIILPKALSRTRVAAPVQGASEFARAKLPSKLELKNNHILSIVLAGWLIMAGTNFIQSGYPLFPNYAIGPFGNHSVSKQGAIHQYKQAIRSYARSNDDSSVVASDLIIDNHEKEFWLRPFLRSIRGQMMITWAFASTFALVAGVFFVLTFGSDANVAKIISLSLACLITVIIALLVLPPNPRFFSWLGAVSYFIALRALALRPVLSMLVACLLAAGVAIRGKRSMFVEVGTPDYRWVTEQKQAILGWQPTSKGTSIRINQPVKGDQCWGIPAPCSPYEAGWKEGKAAKNLFR